MILHDRWQAGVRSVTEDENLRQAKVYFRQGLRSAPSATSAYLLEKVPIIQWLPKYSPTWLFRDVIAGLTIGILVVPQSLAYAKVANIPQQYGLISSWLPMVFYVIFGTSKGEYLMACSFLVVFLFIGLLYPKMLPPAQLPSWPS